MSAPTLSRVKTRNASFSDVRSASCAVVTSNPSRCNAAAMSAASFSGREPPDVGVGAVANDQRHPTGGKGHRRRRQEDERQPRGREDSRERHPFTLIAQSSVWSAKLHLQQIQTSVTDKANGRSPEESQEALLSAANTVKCVGEGPGPLPGEPTGGAASMDAVNAIKGHDASGPAGARAVSPAPAPPASRPSPRLGHHLRCPARSRAGSRKRRDASRRGSRARRHR